MAMYLRSLPNKVRFQKLKLKKLSITSTIICVTVIFEIYLQEAQNKNKNKIKNKSLSQTPKILLTAKTWKPAGFQKHPTWSEYN